MAKLFFIKNMNCKCCIKLITIILDEHNFNVIHIKLGEIETEITNNEQETLFKNILKKEGFLIIENKDLILIERIKQAVFELIYNMNNSNSIIKKSDYLIEKIGFSYQHMSRLFAKYENTTLEKYIIDHKIAKAKELILTNEYTLSEIAYMMDYSSVQYLSNQFKTVTGLSVTQFKSSATINEIE
jgi:AraC-like DNA-binding protein